MNYFFQCRSFDFFHKYKDIWVNLNFEITEDYKSGTIVTVMSSDPGRKSQKKHEMYLRTSGCVIIYDGMRLTPKLYYFINKISGTLPAEKHQFFFLHFLILFV